jgi:hypothetical protein
MELQGVPFLCCCNHDSCDADHLRQDEELLWPLRIVRLESGCRVPDGGYG